MKLTRVEVGNYRSLFLDDANKPFCLVLAEGLNVFAGPNNCGKSNLLRAVALALDPDHPFDRPLDQPAQLAKNSIPRVTLTFRRTAKHGTEDTLFRYVADYERSVVGNRAATFADAGELRFYVSYPGTEATGATRKELFLTAKGVQQGDADLLAKALGQFRKIVRFVPVDESGSDIDTLLRGQFREILHTVLGEHLAAALAKAERRRAGYLEELKADLLAPLGQHISDEVKQLFPEIDRVELIPDVRSISETLEKVRINLSDGAVTTLAGKGTGVRGAVLVAMLRYLADRSKRSLVFAIEEPEAFLHPAAQEILREDLEGLAVRDDVTVLVTTHSPFIVSRDARSQLVEIGKDPHGRTRVMKIAAGDAPHADLLAGLFRDRSVGAMLERAASIPASARGVLFVEGMTDRDYLELAARVAGRQDLIADLHLVPCAGASSVVAQAVLTKAHTPKPLLALFDTDPEGVKALNTLTDSGTFAFRRSNEVAIYGEALGVGTNVVLEAEDLFPNALLKVFIEAYGWETVGKEQWTRPRNIGGWHYGFNGYGKDLLPQWLEENLGPKDCALWVKLLDVVRGKMRL